LKDRDIRPVLIVFDTLARSLVGGDENSAQTMGIAVDSTERIKRETKASLLLIHHTGKNGSAERGSSALRGAADVMIACSGDTGFVELKCDKMKDAEKFPVAKLGLLKITLANGRSSLVIVPEIEDILNEPPLELDLNAQLILGILANEFRENGATHSELEKAAVGQGMSESMFDRTFRKMKGHIRHDGSGQGSRYFHPSIEPKTGASVTPVSNRSHDTPQTGVASPPSLGGDTDTKVEDEPETAAAASDLPISIGSEYVP
jgi:hypothetical protein